MTTASLFDLALAGLVLGLAAWSTAKREAFAAVIAFVAYGLLLALVWVRLGAIDAALTEAAIGGGLTGGLLIGAAARLRGTEAAAVAELPSVLLRIIAAAGSALVALALAVAVLSLPDPAPTLSGTHFVVPPCATPDPSAPASAVMPKSRTSRRRISTPI